MRGRHDILKTKNDTDRSYDQRTEGRRTSTSILAILRQRQQTCVEVCAHQPLLSFPADAFDGEEEEGGDEDVDAEVSMGQ